MHIITFDWRVAAAARVRQTTSSGSIIQVQACSIEKGFGHYALHLFHTSPHQTFQLLQCFTSPNISTKSTSQLIHPAMPHQACLVCAIHAPALPCQACISKKRLPACAIQATRIDHCSMKILHLPAPTKRQYSFYAPPFFRLRPFVAFSRAASSMLPSPFINEKLPLLENERHFFTMRSSGFMMTS